MVVLGMSVAKLRDMSAWQVSRCYQRKPGKDLNGSITTNPIIKTLASNFLSLEKALRPQAYREFRGSFPSSRICKAA